jgi:hypothetical protein
VTTPAPDSGVTAALLQMQKLAEQFGALDNREGEHYRDVGQALTGLGTSVDDLRSTVTGHGEVLESLDGFGEKLAELATAIESLLPPNPGPGHNPAPSVEWWADDLTPEDRAAALARIRAWVDQIYRPHYGYLAAPLAECWDQHPLCLVTLDWFSELWAVLYLRPSRTAGVLNSQAEFATRFLPAVAAQLKAETSSCDHARERQRQRAYAGWGGR